jgi:hypothetical protein
MSGILASRRKAYNIMSFQIFVIRALLGLGIAVVLTRMFRGHSEPLYVVGLATILVGLAYALEYLRKRKQR